MPSNDDPLLNDLDLDATGFLRLPNSLLRDLVPLSVLLPTRMSLYSPSHDPLRYVSRTFHIHVRRI